MKLELQVILFVQLLVSVSSQEILDNSRKSCRMDLNLKTSMEDLFRYHIKIGEVHQQQLLEKFDKMEKKLEKMEKKFDKMELELTLQREVIANQEKKLQMQDNNTCRYFINQDHRNASDVQLNQAKEYQQELLAKLEKLETNQEQQFQKQDNNTHLLNQILTTRCPADYIRKPEFGICYKIYGPISTNAGNLINDCSKYNAELIKISSQEIQNYFAGELGKFREMKWVLIQGNDKLKEGTWMFNDGSRLTYFNWNSDQPDKSGNQNILAMKSAARFKWHDFALTDTSEIGYVCQRHM